MQRSNEVGKPANKQAQIHALDVLCTILWHSMALLQYDYARPMRAESESEQEGTGARMHRPTEFGKLGNKHA